MRLQIFRLPRQPEWLLEDHCPDYSGGTAPDSHRLPFYALAGTQNVWKHHSIIFPTLLRGTGTDRI